MAENSSRPIKESPLNTSTPAILQTQILVFFPPFFFFFCLPHSLPNSLSHIFIYSFIQSQVNTAVIDLVFSVLVFLKFFPIFLFPFSFLPSIPFTQPLTFQTAGQTTSGWVSDKLGRKTTTSSSPVQVCHGVTIGQGQVELLQRSPVLEEEATGVMPPDLVPSQHPPCHPLVAALHLLLLGHPDDRVVVEQVLSILYATTTTTYVALH